MPVPVPVRVCVAWLRSNEAQKCECERVCVDHFVALDFGCSALNLGVGIEFLSRIIVGCNATEKYRLIIIHRQQISFEIVRECVCVCVFLLSRSYHSTPDLNLSVRRNE